MDRVAKVRKFRASSKSAPTRKLAETPRRFHVEFVADADYLVVPEVSSERRDYIPIGYVDKDTLASNLLRVIPGAGLFEFGILSSHMHNAWMRTVAGRLKSDYRYSIHIVYNNYPWPQSQSTEKRKALVEASQGVLSARKSHEGATLADLYRPDSMPDDLYKAHQVLNRAVDDLYGYRSGKDDASRVSFLFNLYSALAAE
jgi:hypothetical protein